MITGTPTLKGLRKRLKRCNQSCNHARFGRTITQAEWVKELKRVSNLWLKEKHLIRDFEWQGGYADFSVSVSNLEIVKKYIAKQQYHHRKMNFQDEFRTLLRRHEVEWDERYICDLRNRVAVE